MSWNDIISKTTVAELVASKTQQKLIVIKKGTTLRDALHTLHDNGILSAPVVDFQEGKSLGFVDVLDIAGFVLSSWRSLYAERPQERNYARDEFFHHPIEDVLNYSRCNYPVSICDTQSVADLLKLFCDPSGYSRMHRIAVTDASGVIYNVISQSDVIAFASKHADLLPMGSKTLQELGLVHTCIMVRLDTPFYSTLETLYRNKISGLALLDENGRISGNFSASDLRGITQKSFNYFSNSTLQFLVKGTDSRAGAPVTTEPTTTLKDIVKILKDQHLHRVYVVDENSRPYGLVTLGDIIHLLRWRM